MYIRKRLSALIFSCVLLLSLAVPAFAAVEDTGFSDVAASDWYAEAATYVREEGLMSGTTSTTFAPNLTMTRAMLATVLYRAAGSPAVSAPDHFTDTADSAYYRDAVAWASENRIISGYGDGRFGPNDSVTREQIAAILWRYDGSKTVEAVSGFNDMDSVANYAVQAVNWAAENGIITGQPDGRFAPKDSATRAQVAVMLHRYLTRNSQTPGGTQVPDETPDTDSSNHVLIAYFSRRGENWQVGNVEKGNTEIIAEMIAEQTGGDLFYIQTVTPYPEDYMETVQQANAERAAGARPALTNDVENWDDYDTVFLGYPIWGGDMPMALYSFMESHDWTGKTIVPFNTHGGSGQAGTVSSIRSTCQGATVQSGIAITGTTAQNDRESALQTVTAWLRESGFTE